jgi:hypothetical protein
VFSLLAFEPGCKALELRCGDGAIALKNLPIILVVEKGDEAILNAKRDTSSTAS